MAAAGQVLAKKGYCWFCLEFGHRRELHRVEGKDVCRYCHEVKAEKARWTEELRRQGIDLKEFIKKSRQDFIDRGYCETCLNFSILKNHIYDSNSSSCLVCITHTNCRHSSYHPRCVAEIFDCNECRLSGRFTSHLRCNPERLAAFRRLQEVSERNLAPFRSFLSKHRKKTF